MLQPGAPDVRSLTDAEAAALYADLDLPPGEDRPYVVTNTVVTVDGKAALGGRATPIGSPFDRQVMRRLRAAAEGVILGAGTLRAEEIEFRLPPELVAGRAARGLPASLTVAIVSARGDLPLYRRLFRVPAPEVTPVVVVAAGADRATLAQLPEWVHVVVAGEEAVDLPRALAALARDFGLRRAVLEGGPSLNAAMLAAGLVDEIFCTIAPRVLGGPALTMVAGTTPLPGGLRELELLSAFAYQGELYLRYSVRQRPTRR